MPKRIVIDACVARSAGGYQTTAKEAWNCREILNAVLYNRHILVFTPSIKGEWRIHSSRFTRKWRRLMSQATQIKFIHDSEKPVLWNRIQESWKRTLDILKPHLIQTKRLFPGMLKLGLPIQMLLLRLVKFERLSGLIPAIEIIVLFIGFLVVQMRPQIYN